MDLRAPFIMDMGSLVSFPDLTACLSVVPRLITLVSSDPQTTRASPVRERDQLPDYIPRLRLRHLVSRTFIH